MLFNPISFVLSRELAKREGVTEDSSLNKFGIIGGALGGALPAVALVPVLARREVESSPAPGTVTGSGTGGTGGGAGGGVGTGTQIAPVPDVRNKGLVDATTDLVKEPGKFKVAHQELTVVGNSVGKVLLQFPSPGEQLQHGGTVTLVIGRETSDKVQMPNVIRLPIEEARELLQNEDFKVTINPTGTKTGVVQEQDPSAGTLVEPGSRVKLTIPTSQGGRG